MRFKELALENSNHERANPATLRTPISLRLRGPDVADVQPTKMNYNDFDNALKVLCEKHGLHVFSQDRDWEVRTIQVVDDSGDVYGLCLCPDGNEVSITVVCRQNNKFIQSFRCNLAALEDVLEEAYAQIDDWIRYFGHTRTPIIR